MRKKKLDLNKQSEDLHLQVDREREENKENLEKLVCQRKNNKER